MLSKLSDIFLSIALSCTKQQLQMDGTTTSTGSNAPGSSANGSSGFLNLGNSPGGIGLFGQTTGSGGGDVLLGSSGFGSALGNGFSNEGGNSLQQSGGGSGNPSFDLNDFPSLGGGAGGVGGGSVGSGASSGTDNGLAAALRQQQQLLQQQMMQQSSAVGGGGGTDASKNLYRLAMSSTIGNGATNNFNMATEDFPALPGAPPTSSGGSGSGFLIPSGSVGDGGAGGQAEGSTVAPSFQRETSKGGGIYGSDLDSGSNQLDYTGLIGGNVVGAGASNQGGVSSLAQTRTSSTTQSGSGGGAAGSAISGDYGLLGLLSVIRMTDADRNRLALGSDLTLLGLNLNSNENLYSTFGGPFSDKPATREPHYQVQQRLFYFHRALFDIFAQLICCTYFLYCIELGFAIRLESSCQCVTTCNLQRSRLVICQNFSWKLCSTSSMLYQRMCCKHTQRRSFTRGSGGTMLSQSYGSSEQRPRMEFLATTHRLGNSSTLTSTRGNVGCIATQIKTLLVVSCRRMTYGLSFQVHNHTPFHVNGFNNY